jgi:hypothetical protein
VHDPTLASRAMTGEILKFERVCASAIGAGANAAA